MHLARWIASLLSTALSRDHSAPLLRPTRIGWNPSLAPGTVDVKGHTVFYAVKGEGEPVLLIHGYGAAMWLWEKQVDILSRSHRIYLIDLIGHGFSDRPRIDYTPPFYIHFFRDFMDAIGVEKASLVGNSMGGGLAWAMAALFPERVNRLVLIDSIPPDVLNQVKNDSFRALVAVGRIPFLLPLAFAGRNKDSIRWILQECVWNTDLITPEVANRQYQLSRIKGTTQCLYSTFKNAKDAVKLRESLSRIDRPTLLIWGENDLIFPPSVGEGLQSAISGSRLQIIEKSGHIPMWETPDKVNPLLLDFLSP
jgi:pimeloyl-ACP methyl ester carboxylesterase